MVTLDARLGLPDAAAAMATSSMMVHRAPRFIR